MDMFKNLLFAIAIVALCAACQNKQAHNYNKTATDPGTIPLNNWALLPFNKVDSVNPILTPGKGSFTDPILNHKVFWEQKDVFNPAIVNRDGKIFMLYRAQDLTGKPAGTSRIGLAVSDDALHFSR